MTSRFMLIFAAVSGFIFVALGAFGAPNASMRAARSSAVLMIARSA